MRTQTGFHRILTLLFALALPLAADAPKEAPKVASARHDLVYACACKDGCPCNTVSMNAGKCTCGKGLEAHHVLKMEGSEALLCACPEGCTCKLDAKDASKCGCGKTVKRVNLKGAGIYFCNCGGSCECNTLSAEPGKCKCGMALKKVD
jgi:hypothetical protein